MNCFCFNYHCFITLHYDDVTMGAIASQITSLTIVYSTVYSGADQSKHQSSASLAFVWGIHRGPVNSPHKWPVTRKMFPFDDVIMESFVVRTQLFRPQLFDWFNALAPGRWFNFKSVISQSLKQNGNDFDDDIFGLVQEYSCVWWNMHRSVFRRVQLWRKSALLQLMDSRLATQ